MYVKSIVPHNAYKVMLIFYWYVEMHGKKKRTIGVHCEHFVQFPQCIYERWDILRDFCYAYVMQCPFMFVQPSHSMGFNDVCVITVNINLDTPLRMHWLSDSTPSPSFTPLAMTVTTMCHLPESSSLSVTCLWTSVAFTCCHPHARPNVWSLVCPLSYQALVPIAEETVPVAILRSSI